MLISPLLYGVHGVRKVGWHPLRQLPLVVALSLLLGSCAFFVPAGEDPIRGTEQGTWHRSEYLQKLLNKATASRLNTGNAVRLLVNGVEAFARRYENLKTARFVLVKTFIFSDDEEGRRMANALAQRARAGVPVVLQYDVKGSIAGIGEIAEMLKRVSLDLPVGEKRIVHEMRKAGVHIVPTNSPGRPVQLREWWENTARLARRPIAALKRAMESLVLFDYCDHAKYFITGHEGGEVRAIVGGMNIASEYALGGIAGRKDKVTGCSGWRDTDVEVRGPAAYAAFEEFLADIRRHTGRSLPEKLLDAIRRVASKPEVPAGRARVRFVANHPLQDKKRYTEELYRILLQATPAGEPVFIATPYFAPSRRLREAIIAHAELGGTVTVLTNSAESNDISVLSDAARYATLEIMKKTENFHLREWLPQTAEGEHTMHQKVASFGRYGVVAVGSFNLDAQSAVHNAEAILLIDDPALRERFDRMIERDLSSDRTRPVRKDDRESEPVLKRIRSFLTHKLAWYWL